MFPYSCHSGSDCVVLLQEKKTVWGEARTLRRACLASTAVIRLNLSLLTPVGNLMGMPSLLCKRKRHRKSHRKSHQK